MATVTKAALMSENAVLKDRLVLIQRELEAMKTNIRPTATPTSNGRIAISSDNPRFAGLDKYEPHSRITCPKHGASKANKAGFCIECAMALCRPPVP